MTLVNIALDTHPSPPLQLQHFDVPVARFGLGDPGTVLAMCSDGALLAIRYLTVNDLLGMIRQKRLMQLALELRARSEWAYLVIGGELTPGASGKALLEGGETNWTWGAVQGALLSVQEAGVGIWNIRETDLRQSIETLAKRDRTPNRVRPKREALFVTEGEDMLLAMPGIGEDHCETLLKECGGAGWALVALTDPDSKIPGIGPATKAKARAALGLKDDMTFTIVCKEASTANDRPDNAGVAGSTAAAAA